MLLRGVAGITLSPKQVARGTELAKQRGLTNVSFQVTSSTCNTQNMHEHSLWFVGDSQRSGGSLDDWWTLLQVMNALAMDFEDDTFDLVWACESGEHMPDKKKYVEEMARVLKPGTSSTP